MHFDLKSFFFVVPGGVILPGRIMELYRPPRPRAPLKYSAALAGAFSYFPISSGGSCATYPRDGTPLLSAQ